MNLGLIAGKGDIPRLIAEDRESQGKSLFIIAIEGFVEDWMRDYPHEVCGIAETGRMIRALKASDCDTVSLIGRIQRPDFSKLKPDFKAISLLPRVLSAATKGDDALLRAMIEIFEGEGFKVVGAQELLSSLQAKAGLIGSREPTRVDIADIQLGYHIAGEIGRLDIGQGAVIANGLVLAVEAQEGTDEMLRRVERLPMMIRGNEDERLGVLVKRPKPIQERRIDLPTIGPSTVRLTSAAGLSAIAIVEGGTLIVQRQEIINLADSLGICVVCLDKEGQLP